MNPNAPNDNTPLSNRLIVIHINKADKNCLVRKENGGKSFVCEMADWLIDGIMLHDFVEVKTAVNGNPIVTNYFVNNEVYGAIHNSYQTTLDGMVLNEDGVPYE